MRGAKQPQTFLLVFGLLFSFSGWTDALYRCDGSPEAPLAPRSPSENRFMLKISGNSHMYVPGEKYSITLQGTRQQPIPEKFIGFALTVEPSEFSLSKEATEGVGNFQLYGDALTKFSERCPHMVMQSNNAPRTEVNVHWTAPPAGSGCVVFRATVLEQRDLWYMHDGLLSRTICEDVQENLDEQPPVLEKCCACDEAKYEVTFEGLWSRHTHPKDFPPNGWLTRFSDVIGASHTVDYRFWEYGGVASEGLREVAERGWTKMLESELKAESEHIRTIIKARGISYPNITGKTFAVFRVDRKHHLMSLVSMIVPSPDWIVGVSGLELCLRNCSWVEFKVLNLKPWDAGTDSGTTYTSPDSPTTPREPIRRITSKYPADPANPFYDDSGEEMKPLAKLYLTRQRLYEKSCTDDSISTEEEEPIQSSDCAVGDWGPWTACSATCGRGFRYRHRFYLYKGRAETSLCNRELFIREPCQASRRCSGEGYPSPIDPSGTSPLLNDPRCAVGPWEEWSSCSATCGNAVQTRSRRYLMSGGMKLCGGLAGAPELQQTRPCEVIECDGDEEEEPCRMVWTDWSACSTTCGRGTKIRTGYAEDQWPDQNGNCKDARKTEEVECPAAGDCRLSLEDAQEQCTLPVEVGNCKQHIERFYFDPETATCKGFIFRGCKQNANNFVTKDDCYTSCSALIGECHCISTPAHKCSLVRKEVIICSDNQSALKALGNPVETFCTVNRGGLKVKQMKRLAKYGVRLSAVMAYHYPLANQFGTASPDCDIIKAKETKDVEYDLRGIQTDNMVIDSPNGSMGAPPTNEAAASGEEPVDCRVSKWSRWSPCSVSCGKGIKQKTRHVLSLPHNGGKNCPKLTRVKPCGRTACDNDDGDGNEADDSSEKNPDWGDSVPPGGRPGDCVMGAWSSWSPCSATCGVLASRVRTRPVLVPPSMNGQPCGDRVQTESCLLLPCKV